jgi:hypothetical protein
MYGVPRASIVLMTGIIYPCNGLYRYQKSIRIEKKILKYTSHQNFIARCIQESVVPKGFQIKWNICLDTTDSDKDRYRDILLSTSVNT